MDNDEVAFLHTNEEESTRKCFQYIFALVHHREHHVQGTMRAI